MTRPSARAQFRPAFAAILACCLALAAFVSGLYLNPHPARAQGAATTNAPSGQPLPRFVSLRAGEVNMRSGPGVQYPVDWVYRRRHRNSDHPLFTRWSDEYSLTVWAVEMNAGGHQMPHIHPSGFLSGVYYPQLPQQVTDPGDTNGFIEFFQAPEQFKLHHQPRLQLFPPEEGVMYLFPSAYFHRTIPFTGEGTRISVAFDLVAL